MRAGLVRNVGVGMLALGALALGACDDNPIDFDEKDGVRFRTNPSSMVIPAGRTAELDVAVLNQGAEPTYDPVDAQAAQCGGPASVTVAEDPAQTSVQPPGQLLVTAGTTLGAACVVVSGGGVTDTVDVIVVADGVAVVSAPDTLRAGQTGTVEVRLTSFDGSTVTPFSAQDVAWSTDAANVVDVDDTGGLTTEESGTAAITATWTGTQATGTAGLGVSREAATQVTVVANVPASLELENGGDFGALEAGVEVETEAIVRDVLGNQNTFEDEVTGATAVSSNPAVATAEARLDFSSSVNVFIVVTTQGPGTADITGVVETSEGDFPYTASVTVLAPSIASISPTSGPYGQVVTITGSGFVASGFETNVFVNDGELPSNLGNFTVVSDTEIQAQMATYRATGPYSVSVVVGGVGSNTVEFTQNTIFDEAASEPNDFVLGGTPAPVSLPLDIDGAFVAEPIDNTIFGSGQDYVQFTLSEDATIDVTFLWVGGPDNDVYVTDAGFNAFQCGFAGASANVPEAFQCELAAGDYFMIFANFDLEDATWQARVSVVD